MKAYDSSIKCGVGFDTGNASYNSRLFGVMQERGGFCHHPRYPGGAAAALLQTPSQIPGIVSSCRSQISLGCGITRKLGGNLYYRDRRGTVTGAAAALFAADDFATWLENGIWNVDYQELHSGFLTTANAFDSAAYGAKMVGYLAASGETIIPRHPAAPWSRFMRSRNPTAVTPILLVNKDPNNSYTVTVNVSGATLASTGTTYTYNGSSINQGSISGVGSSSFSITASGLPNGRR